MLFDNRLQDCQPPSPNENGYTTYTFTGVPVTFRVFGITRHTVVYPSFSLAIKAGNNCPPNR